MLPTLNYFIVAQGLSVDQDTHSLTIFKVAELLAPTKLPRPLPKLWAVCSWIATEATDGSDFQAIVRVHLPGKADPVDSQPINFGFQKSEHARLRFYFDALEVKAAGRLRFELLLNAKPAGNFLLTITDPEQPGGG